MKMQKNLWRTWHTQIYLAGWMMVLSLSALLVVSCNDAYYPNGKPSHYEMYHIDSLGVATILAETVLRNSTADYECLPDGRILVSTDSLCIYDPVQGSTTLVLPSWSYPQNKFPDYDISSDGSYFYFSSSGIIRRLNLQDHSSLAVYQQSGKYYAKPKISRDGRYLGFLCNLMSYTKYI
ncbi:MAG: hypothetical protein U1C33_06855, partial [Candidatus Cloacimonadaceae bacterium]|nr:hypothetical protein [Candidatus Cloacimonadaceae bacterium]